MKKLFIVAVIILLLVLVNACGTSAETTTIPSSTPSSTTTKPVTSTTAQPSTTPVASASLTPSSTLSEQPDMVAYRKYFSELGVGRVPSGADSPINLERNVTLFKTTDQLCLYGTIIMECQVRDAIYDTGTSKVVHEGGLPKPMMGGFAGWAPMPVPAGKYEYKVYVGDALVGVFPFDVVAQ